MRGGLPIQHLISDKQVVYNFSCRNKPVAFVQPGDTIVFHTQDCFSNQISHPRDRLEQLDWDRMNPAAGPAFINDAEKGDTLKVTVKKIKVADSAVIAAGKGMGLFANQLPDTYIRILEIKENRIHFSDSVTLPVKPMIGVLGVAPEGDASFNCGIPGRHGGNMDNNMIGEGATVYLPVSHPGALLALGDVHAVMGDGEVCICGAETRAEVAVSVDLLKGKTIHNPIVENDAFFAAVASEDTLDKAVETSVFDMGELIGRATALEKSEIAMLLSLAGNAEICQVVDPRKTARFVMTKKVLESISFRL